MGDVNFAAPADAIRGYRCPAEPNAGLDWLYTHVYKTWLPPRIMYPRPISERGAYVHSEFDKWFAGEPWFPRVGVAYGVWPFKVFLTGNYPAGTTWAWYPHEHNGTTVYYLRLYNAGMTAGTYNFKIVVRDQLFNSDSVNISLTVYAANDANILDHFRIYQQGAGGGGTGSPASPFNDFGTLWGNDHTNTAQLPTNAIVLMKGTATLTLPNVTNTPNADNFFLGTTRPRTLIGAYGSDITFDMTTSAKSMTCISGTTDMLLKNFKLTGQKTGATNQLGQANFSSRCNFHDLTLKNFDSSDPGNLNISAFGGDGNTYEKEDSTVLGMRLENISATSGQTNAGCISLMEVTRILVDECVATNISAGGNYVGFVFRFKHHSHDCEVRRFQVLGGQRISSNSAVASAPFQFGTGGGDNVQERLIFRCNNIDVGAANRAVSFGGSGAEVRLDIRYYFNSVVGTVYGAADPGAGSSLHLFHNIHENANSATNHGVGTLHANWGIMAGESAIDQSNLSGAEGSLVDNNGVPLLTANYGWGSYLPSTPG